MCGLIPSWAEAWGVWQVLAQKQYLSSNHFLCNTELGEFMKERRCSNALEERTGNDIQNNNPFN